MWTPGYGERTAVRCLSGVRFGFPFRPVVGHGTFEWNAHLPEPALKLTDKKAAVPFLGYAFDPKVGAVVSCSPTYPRTRYDMPGQYMTGPLRWRELRGCRPLPSVALQVANFLMERGEDAPLLVRNYPLRADAWRARMVDMMRVAAGVYAAGG